MSRFISIRNNFTIFSEYLADLAKNRSIFLRNFVIFSSIFQILLIQGINEIFIKKF